MNNRFKIVIPAYNCSKWLRKNLNMIEQQTYRNFEVCIVDDASTDPRQKEIIEEFRERCGWKAIFNEERKGALFNIVEGIKALQCVDNDIIVPIDGDDWLFDRHVLSLLNLYYLREDIYLTYGQYYSLSHQKRGISAPITEDDIEQKNYRKMPWQFSALRTFKYFLWRQIREEDLRDQNGIPFKVTWDKAFMFPMLEMAGHHIRFVSEIIYTYNDLNPICDSKVRREEQRRCEQLIRSRKPYDRVLDGDPERFPLCLSEKVKFALIRTIIKVRSLRVRNRYSKVRQMIGAVIRKIT